MEPSIVPENSSYLVTVNSTEKIVIFSDSIPRGTRLNELNSSLNRGYAKMKSFPGAELKGLPHYIESTLKDGSFDTAVIHVSVTHLSKNKNKHSLDELVTNLRNIALKCRSFGITKVYISEVAVNNKMSASFLESINTKISDMCRESSCVFIDNRKYSKSIT